MSYFKNRLEWFVKDLNALISDPFLTTYKTQETRGRFVLTINDTVKFDNGNVGCVIDLVFKEDEKNLAIYHYHYSGQSIDLDAQYKRAYWEIFKHILLSQDSVGKLQDGFDNKINVLSFKTLMTTGLESLNKTNK